MNKATLLSLLLAVSFASCKKCYDCEKVEYCCDCSITDNGQEVNQYTNCFSSSIERSSEMDYIQTSAGFQGYIATCTTTDPVVDEKEICGTGKITLFSKVSFAEVDGYEYDLK